MWRMHKPNILVKRTNISMKPLKFFFCKAGAIINNPILMAIWSYCCIDQRFLCVFVKLWNWYLTLVLTGSKGCIKEEAQHLHTYVILFWLKNNKIFKNSSCLSIKWWIFGGTHQKFDISKKYWSNKEIYCINQKDCNVIR